MVLISYFPIFHFNFLRTSELKFSMAVYNKYKNHCNLFSKVVNNLLEKDIEKISTSLLNYELWIQALSNLICLNRLGA